MVISISSRPKIFPSLPSQLPYSGKDRLLEFLVTSVRSTSTSCTEVQTPVFPYLRTLRPREVSPSTDERSFTITNPYYLYI